MAGTRTGLALIFGLFGCLSFSQGSDDIGSICQKLWNTDSSSLVNGKDFQLNLQNQLSYHNRYDRAPRKLFLRVNEQKLRSPTFVAFKSLLDNYVRMVGVTETYSLKESRENAKFLSALMATKPIKELHKYLVSRGKASASEASFKQALKVTWFYFYRRNAYRDSSGFEHVFLGESTNKNGATQVTGFHNWLQFYLEEKRNLVNYYGFFKAKKTKAPVQLKLQFSWHNHRKPVTTLFLGTSPEFEIGIYTACFILRPNLPCSCNINGQKIAIKSYKYSNRYVGSVFPII